MRATVRVLIGSNQSIVRRHLVRLPTILKYRQVLPTRVSHGLGTGP